MLIEAGLYPDKKDPRTGASGTPVVLITTADMLGDRGEALAKLVGSVERFRAANPHVTLRHYMLLQRCDDAEEGRRRFGLPDWMTVTASPTRLSLSAARNRMIDAVLVAERALLSFALVAFPDDDAWFPDGTLEHIHRRFEEDGELDYWFCRYGMAARLPDRVDEQTPSLQEAVARASSNTMMVRGGVLQAIGGFDEGLGLGTPARSGEDTDFSIRSYFAARKARFAPHVMIGHRDFDAGIRANYYAGTLVAIARHRWRTPAAQVAFARKLLVGVALVIKRDLSPAGLREAVGMLRANCAAPNLASVLGPPSGIRPGTRMNGRETRWEKISR